MFERRNLKLLLLANLAILFAILFIKLLVSVNSSLEEPFNYWWMMIMPNVMYPVGVLLYRYENKNTR